MYKYIFLKIYKHYYDEEKSSALLTSVVMFSFLLTLISLFLFMCLGFVSEFILKGVDSLHVVGLTFGGIFCIINYSLFKNRDSIKVNKILLKEYKVSKPKEKLYGVLIFLAYFIFIAANLGVIYLHGMNVYLNK